MCRGYERELLSSVHLSCRWLFNRLPSWPIYDTYSLVRKSCSPPPKTRSRTSPRYQDGVTGPVVIEYSVCLPTKTECGTRSFFVGARHKPKLKSQWVQKYLCLFLGKLCLILLVLRKKKMPMPGQNCSRDIANFIV